MFPVGVQVFSHVFFDPNTPKTVWEAIWDGVEYRYSVVDTDGVVDTGYLAKDFTFGMPTIHTDELLEWLGERIALNNPLQK